MDANGRLVGFSESRRALEAVALDRLIEDHNDLFNEAIEKHEHHFEAEWLFHTVRVMIIDTEFYRGEI